MLTSKSSFSYALCCNLVNISRRMESKVSFGIKILWAIRWLWKVPLYVLQKPRKRQKESGPNDMGHPVGQHTSSKALQMESLSPVMIPMGMWGPENMKIKNIWVLSFKLSFTKIQQKWFWNSGLLPFLGKKDWKWEKIHKSQNFV